MAPNNDTTAYAIYCNSKGARRLSKSFQPGKYDVMCARGKKAHDSEGNRRFRALVKLHQEKYAACSCKVEKSKIVSHIVDTVRNASPNGGFVKIIDGAYWEAGDRAAKEKVGQTFRDLLHTKYSSSTKAKARARMERKGKQESMDRREQYRVESATNPQCSSSSLVSEDNFSAQDDSSCEQLSPPPAIKPVINDVFQPGEPLDVMETLRSSIHTIDPRLSVNKSLRDSSRLSSLFRGSIQAIEEQRPSLMRDSIHSFAVGSFVLRESISGPLSFLKGNGAEAEPMTGIEKDFVSSNMDVDDELQEFCDSMQVAV